MPQSKPLPGQSVWQLQDYTGQLWWSLDRPALEAHVAKVNQARTSRLDRVEPKVFRSSCPYGYEVN